jgi:hypothetical protein
MRPRACLGALMLVALAACETLPQNVKIDVDGRTIELKKKPDPAPEPPDAGPR